MYLHQHRTHPWADDYSHNLARRAAEVIARDITTNGRWGAADQPVYDVSGDGDWRYLGDLSDDSVRCRVGGPIISIFTPKLPGRAELVERIYLKIVPAAYRWRDLFAAVTAAVTSGRLVADESIETAVTRLFRNGYDEKSLANELPDPEPVGATEIAARAGVERSTVEQWTRRHTDFPRSRWTVGGRPAWAWHEVRVWLERTGRSQGAKTT
jgi:predicted DNA-binding transcriptional regulator AlpA